MNVEFVPILRVGDNLLVSLQGDLDDKTILRLEAQITEEIAKTNALGALIDVSGLIVVDSFIARVIARIVGMIKLLGADAVVVGMQPAVAITLVELGVDMSQIHTALDADRGMRLLARIREQNSRGIPMGQRERA
jgi:rsbT antagonist protein RsbS